MTTTLREMLDRRANAAGPPNLDLEELVGLGEARLRRRRLAAVVGSAIAAVAVVAALALGAALNNPVHRGVGPPAKSPSPSPTELSAPPAPIVRELLYVDVARQPSHDEGTFHFGDRAITSDDAFVFTDVTDDGFVYTSGDDLWFSDGESPVQIGSNVCGLPRNGIRHQAQDAVITGNAGSLVAWFACGGPVLSPQSQTLVVYDTGSRREVVREPMPFCATVAGCSLDAVIGEHIYLTRYNGATRPERPFIYDVNTATRAPATSRSFDDDVRNNPRGLVFGDTWETATVGEGIRAWGVVGRRLVAIAGDVVKEYPTTAFDTTTHQAVHLRLPLDYHPNGARFDIFEWLDDDTVALAPGHNLESADIITCRLSDGRCQLAVKTGPDDTMRLMPTQSLPG